MKSKKKIKKFNLKSKIDFEELFEKGTFIKHQSLGLRYLKTEDSKFFLGYTVSKKIKPRAVDRNLIKRRMRSEFYDLRNFFVKNCPSGIYLFCYLRREISLSSDISKNIAILIKKIN